MLLELLYGVAAVTSTPLVFGIPLAIWFGYKTIANSYKAYEAYKGPDLQLSSLIISPAIHKSQGNPITSPEGDIAIKNEGDKTFFFRKRCDYLNSTSLSLAFLSAPSNAYFDEFKPEYELIGFKDKNGDLYQVTGEKKEGFFSNLWNSAKELASKFCNLIPFIPNTSHLPHYEIADISTNTFSDKLIIGDSNKSEGFTCNKISGADEFSQYKAKPSFWEKTKRALLEFSPYVNLNNESRLKTIVNNLCLHNENHAYANQNYENSKEKSEMSDGQNSQEEVISNKDQEVKQNGNSLTNPNGEKLQTNVKDKELGKKK